jgi:GTP diphosphokinase / guanosine-3',5'-bis(diphosphate) 3'-diphosphatase
MIMDKRREKFLDLLKEKKYDNKDITIAKKALAFIETILKPYKRISGDTFFDHNVRVAEILLESKSAPEIIIAALVHGTIKYVPEKEVLEKFGREILELIKGVEEIKSVKSKNVVIEAEALRKILLTAVKDVRVILIKLADKLDNIENIDELPKKEQLRVCNEVLDVYAPLAYRLGVDKIRTRLEDRAFEVIHPKNHQEIVNFLEESKEERKTNIKKAIKKIGELVKGIKIIKIKGRPKHIYSIYKKVINRKIPLNEQYDLLGIRIITKEVKDCYVVLGLLHEHFEPIEGKLKDYITNPKQNGYQSLHTAVIFDNKKIEIQIRTQQMDEFAEEGFAAHWRYKGLKSDNLFEKRMSWLKGVLDLQKEGKGREFLENIKLDLFIDEIYCYTPKGDVKYFSLGATLLDFAYSVHEEVGNKTIGGRINGKFVTMKTKISKGDVIEVLTSKNQRPRRNWLKFVQSGRAKQKIRKSVKKYQGLPALHYRTFKPLVQVDHDTLVDAPDYESASCIIAKCCRPVPKENIVGIITKRRLISVHSPECKQALKEENRWVGVEWKETFTKKIKMYVEATERSGLLADLLHTIARAHFHVEEAKAKIIGTDRSQCSFVIAPKRIDEIEDLIKRIKKVKSVKKVFFE